MRRLLALCFVFVACSSVPPAVVIDVDAGAVDAGLDGLTADAGTQPLEVDAGFDAGPVEVDAGTPDAGYVKSQLIVERPFNEVVPVGYQAGTPVPLVVLLHGYSATAATQDAYFHLSELAQSRGFLLALPEGTIDQRGQHFWNATDACCGFGKTVDDVAYLTAVIEDLQARYTIDSKRIFLVGHSNGAFMSHRMACDRSHLIAGIVALAGDVWADATKCQPTESVNVLQVHGTLDAVIRYGGGVALAGQPPFPSAEDSVGTWGEKNHCTGSGLERIGGDLDLVFDLPFAETQRFSYRGCPSGSAELWKIVGGSHIPNFNSAWAETIYTWLQAHPRP